MAHGDITHIDIPVTDHARAKHFYGALFGWDIVDYPGYENYPMWRAPNQISGGGLPGRDMGMTEVTSYVEVDSIDDALAKVRANGGSVVQEKMPITDTSWSAVFEDPDGNTLALYEGETSAD
ncbi:MAG: VOC family protein [Propionibacterium sp.]|nr:VOC family protein [Propionibacterium sp.]